MAKWDWDKLVWGKVRRLVFNLQKRIYKATKLGKYKKAKSLMYLLQNSYYATLLAVRTVTTENKGKRTAGVDRVKVSIKTDKKAKKGYKCRNNLKIDLIRYADDFVVLHEDKEVIEESKIFIGKWLEIRGLTLSEEKTFRGKSFCISTAKTFSSEIVHSADGFDFLGHHIRHYENRIKGTYKLKLLNGSPTEQRRANATHVLRVEPAKEKVKLHYREISDTIWKLKTATPSELITIKQYIRVKPSGNSIPYSGKDYTSGRVVGTHRRVNAG